MTLPIVLPLPCVHDNVVQVDQAIHRVKLTKIFQSVPLVN